MPRPRSWYHASEAGVPGGGTQSLDGEGSNDRMVAGARAEAGSAGQARRRRGSGSDLAWAAGLAAATTLAAALLAHFVFGRIPHVQDSVAQLFQARIFAGGRLWAPGPPLPELFDYANVILRDGRWYSQYPPGQALLLLPGVVLGIPWLVNPLLGGLTVAGIYWLGLELFDRATARLAALLGLISPFLLLMSAEFMSHAGALCAVTFTLVFYFRILRTGRRRDGILAGAFCALALLIRPLSTVAMVTPCVIHGAWRLARGGRRLLDPMLAAALIAAVGGLVMLLYNWGTTGHPLRLGYIELHGAGHGLGFGRTPWGGEAHTLARGWLFTWDRIRGLHERLFEWPGTSLWPLALGLALPARAFSLRKRWLLLAFPLSLLGWHLFYWYHDRNDCFGPRYVYEALGPLLVLSGAGLILAARRVASLLGRRDGSAALPFLLAVLLIAAFSAAGGLTRWPRLFQSRPAAELPGAGHALPGRNPFEVYGRDYWGVSPTLGQAVAAHVHDRALIFVDTRVPAHPNRSMRLTARHLKYGSAFAHQQPYVNRARVVYAHLTPFEWDPGRVESAAERAAVMYDHARVFPGRKIYYFRAGMSAPVEVRRAASGDGER